MPSPILAAVLDTPAGELTLLAHAGTLVAAGFTSDPASLQARLEPALRAAALAVARGSDLAWLVQPMRDYFDGDLTAPDGLPVRQPGGPGRQRMWQLMRAVPAGTMMFEDCSAVTMSEAESPFAASCLGNTSTVISRCFPP